jgi:NADH-quinone oxidoreductase subunit N
MTTDVLWILLPEIILVATAVGIYLGGAFVEDRRPWALLALAGVCVAAVALGIQQGATPVSTHEKGTVPFSSDENLDSPPLIQQGVAPVSGPITVDHLACYSRWLALLLGGLLILTASKPLDSSGTPEYIGSLLLTVAGVMLAAEAADLVLIFVALELISIPTYILLYLGHGGSSSREAAVKYFFLSLLASAILLYGFSFLYGSTGTTNLAAMQQRLAQPGSPAADFGVFVKLSMVLIFAGLGFRITAVPFHFYAPDVFQGTTYANAALLSAIPKAGGLLVLARLTLWAVPALPFAEPYAWRIAFVLAVLTMTLGNVVALWQDNLRRLLAYSTIAHAGYMLVGLAAALAVPGVANHWNGLGAVLLYLVVYALASIGTLAALAYLGRDERQLEAVDELAGLGHTRPWAAAVIAVFMFSLTGIPPLAGFWGKLAIFGSALYVDFGAVGEIIAPWWFTVLAVIGVINAAISAGYYLRIVSVMYFRAPLATPKAQGGAGAWYAALACAALVVAIGFYPGPLWRGSNVATPRTAAESMVESK